MKIDLSKLSTKDLVQKIEDIERNSKEGILLQEKPFDKKMVTITGEEALQYLNHHEYRTELCKRKFKPRTEMKTRYDSQSDNVQNWLLSGKPITPMIALNRFGVFRLSAIIYRLRKHHNIHTEIVWQGRKNYAKYTLIKKTKE